MADLYKSEYCKGHDIPISHLDYSYIEKCSNVKELEKILKVLRSGDEGRYPHLEEATEKKIEALNPKSRMLRKCAPVKTSRDVESEEWSEIEKDLKAWQSDIQQVEKTLKGSDASVGDSEAELPPVRGSGTNINTQKSEAESSVSGTSKPKRVKPRDYREWDKIDIDAELEKVDKNEGAAQETKTTVHRDTKPSIPSTIESSNLTDQEKIQKAEREKEKGNEAFRSGDYEEALVYYNRSLSLIPTVTCRNNRAQTYIKLKKWDEAEADCNAVLKVEPDNMKALLRRGVVCQGQQKWQSAKEDLERVLQREPGNKRATQILTEVQTSIDERKKRGRRMVIEEVEEMSDEEGKTVTQSAVSESPEETKPKIEVLDSPKHSAKENVNKGQTASNPQEQKPHGKKGKNKNKKKNKKKDKEGDKSNVGGANTSKVQAGSAQTGSSEAEKGPQKVTTNKVTGNTGSEEKRKTASQARSKTECEKDTVDMGETPTAAAGGSKKEELTTKAHTAKEVKPGKDQSENHTEENERKADAAGECVCQHGRQLDPIPSGIEVLKTQGNELFRTGRYGEAADLYTKAIEQLKPMGSSQDHNMCVLYSNRGNCYHKIGDMENCLKDCIAALDINAVAIKPRVRRAAAYEAMEKFRKAYTDYRHAVYLDQTLDVAHQGLNRCAKILQQMDGPNWREKVPPMKLLSPPAFMLSSSSKHRCARRQSSGDGPPVSSREEQFSQLKTQGNDCVKKEEFAQAVECYTKCIELFPNKTAPYTNRALCNLKLGKLDPVISDCSVAILQEPTNVKALFRRAQAYKMKGDYEWSKADLERLLIYDPKSATAKRELQLLRSLEAESLTQSKPTAVSVATQLEEQKAKVAAAVAEVERKKQQLAEAAAAVEESKKQLQQKRQKIRIQETDDSESEGENDAAAGEDDTVEKLERQPKIRIDMSKSTPVTAGESDEQMDDAVSADSQNENAAPGAQPTPYEFIHAWSTLKPSMGLEPYAKLLQQVDPTDLPKIISNKLDGDMLSIIIKCVDLFIDQSLASRCLAILQNLVSVPRFEMVTMFMSASDVRELNSVLDRLAEWGSCSYLDEDLKRLREAYSLD